MPHTMGIVAVFTQKEICGSDVRRKKNGSEAERDDVAHAPLRTGGEVVVVQASYILHMPDLKDVMDANDNLCIRAFGIHDIAAFRKVHQIAVTSVLFQIWVVFI